MLNFFLDSILIKLFLRLIILNKDQLVRETDKLLDTIFLEVATESEPHIVELLAKNIHRLKDKWLKVFKDEKRFLNKYLCKVMIKFTDITIETIFVHQKPYVLYSDGNIQCEIGDLLFLHLLGSHMNNQQMRGILFQAKKVKSKTHILTGKDLEQLYLYENWPKFKWKYPKSYNTDEYDRDIYPKEGHEGGRYLTISSLTDKKFMTSESKSQLEGVKSLGLELIELLKLTAGKKVYRNENDDKYKSNPNDWSKIIKEIHRIGINNSKKLGRKSRNEIIGNEKALRSFMMYLNPTEFYEQSIGGTNYEENKSQTNERYDGAKFPIILVQTRFSKII